MHLSSSLKPGLAAVLVGPAGLADLAEDKRSG